jgi:hypothetical protein
LRARVVERAAEHRKRWLSAAGSIRRLLAQVRWELPKRARAALAQGDGEPSMESPSPPDTSASFDSSGQAEAMELESLDATESESFDATVPFDAAETAKNPVSVDLPSSVEPVAASEQRDVASLTPAALTRPS